MNNLEGGYEERLRNRMQLSVSLCLELLQKSRESMSVPNLNPPFAAGHAVVERALLRKFAGFM
jgi:hypothetical protein